MELVGKIIVALPEMTGTSKAGNAWKKREYVLETIENYPKKVHFDFFGERADLFPLNVGDVIKLSFDIESREYNGRWYTSIRGFKAEPAAGVPGAAPAAAAPAYGAAPAAPAMPPAPAAFPQAPAAPAYGADATEDLPF